MVAVVFKAMVLIELVLVTNESQVAIYPAGDVGWLTNTPLLSLMVVKGLVIANDWARGDYPRAYGWGYNASGAAGNWTC